MIKKLLLLITFLILAANLENAEVLREPLIQKRFTVTLTTYTVDPHDRDHVFTANMFKINRKNPVEHRIIAISRDLQQHFHFGDSVMVLNAGEYDGKYVVKDLMNKRWNSRIDVLINYKGNHTRLDGVEIIKL